MKKTITAALIAAAILAVWIGGRAQGIFHTVHACEIYTVERYDPDNPESTARPDGYDQTVYIIIDGMEIEKGMHQG